MPTPLNRAVRLAWIALALAAWALPARAGDLALSDPANVAPPPAWAIGFPRRDADLDALPGFKEPPPGYGEVAFYWWVGDPLTRERLAWQLEQLRGKGVMGLQINYAHSDRGGQLWGLTYPSDPPLFSDAWWRLVGWFIGEAKKQGMAVSLSDYTLGISQGWSADEVLREDPELAGAVLQSQTRDVDQGPLEWTLPANTLMVAALDPATGAAEDLRAHVVHGALHWRAPPGRRRVMAVFAQRVRPSLDPMNPRSGPAYANKFFGQFEERNPGEGGRGLNFFFSDELEFRVGGNLWTARFAEEFAKRKGYDLVPELPALFADTGPRTPKVRLDYRDVMVSLTEEGFFKPVFDWHQRRGMVYGCDHGGRGRNVVEFGDYFRTQRWNQGPGCDQPGLGRDLIKNKVAASIAHLYLRPRVWLEGYYGSGWGTSSAALADATFANFAQGQNLLTLHGLYYTTHGGWWEWAPPCNHFRMPYWKHMDVLMQCVQRLSYLLSQGHHRCDVAIVYPVAPMEAGMGGNEAVAAAFGTGQRLYGQGIDFDFMDFESLARAKVEGKELCVSGERYRVLILPAMRAVRWTTLTKALELHRAGGIVLSVGAVPEASDRAGRDDPELDAAVGELFGDGRRVLRSPDEAAARIDESVPRDFAASAGSPHFMHRKVGPRDVYLVYGAPQGTECRFRATGAVELWDPWTGDTRAIPVIEQSAQGTRLRMPLTEKEAQLIVFSPGKAAPERTPPATATSETRLEGEWQFELVPTMDNRWGDFHWPPTPAMIGAEARQFRYADETAPNPPWQDPKMDDSGWAKAACSFGPKFWKLGPLPETGDAAAIDERLAALEAVDPSAPVETAGAKHVWQPYAFSWRWGVEGDPGHQGYHGLKEEVSDEFLALGRLKFTATSSAYEQEPGGSRYYLWTSVLSERDQPGRLLVGGNRPAAAWLRGARMDKLPAAVQLKAGSNPLLLRYDTVGRGFAVVDTGQSQIADEEPAVFTGQARWIWAPDDQETVATRFFRKTFELEAAAAKARLRVTCDNGYTAWLNGKQLGSGGAWAQVQEYDVGGLLRRGGNVIAVAGRNEGGPAGLIAELTIEPPQGPPRRIASDGTWRFAQGEEKGWREPGHDDSRWAKASPISEYQGSLWATHPNGPPRLDGLTGTGQPVFKPSRMAMTWHGDPKILPFDVRPRAAEPAGWFRFTSPPGLRAMTLTVRGAPRVWVDGQEQAVEKAGGPNRWRAAVAGPSAACVKVAVRVGQERGCYGGAALPEPVTLDCGPGLIRPGDWSQIDGLASYSGGAWYRKTVSLSAEQAAAAATLDLGEVVASAEVRVNGQPAGARVAPPWRWDVSRLVKSGENHIEVLVHNTLANHYLTVPTRYRGSPVSGLLGPVRIEFRKETP